MLVKIESWYNIIIRIITQCILRRYSNEWLNIFYYFTWSNFYCSKLLAFPFCVHLTTYFHHILPNNLFFIFKKQMYSSKTKEINGEIIMKNITYWTLRYKIQSTIVSNCGHVRNLPSGLRQLALLKSELTTNIYWMISMCQALSKRIK